MLRVKVQNGTIVLPPHLRKAWRNREIDVQTYGKWGVLLLPHLQERKTRDLEGLKMWAGRWKGRIIPDPVKWQRMIRKEWDRRLT